LVWRSKGSSEMSGSVYTNSFKVDCGASYPYLYKFLS